jgi:hypothetical protein
VVCLRGGRVPSHSHRGTSGAEDTSLSCAAPIIGGINELMEHFHV